MLPLLYARESDHVVDTLEEVTALNKIKKVLKGTNVIKRMIYQGRVRKEQANRNRIKKASFWMR